MYSMGWVRLPPADINRVQLKAMVNVPSPFTDYKVTFEDIIAEGDKIAIRMTTN